MVETFFAIHVFHTALYMWDFLISSLSALRQMWDMGWSLDWYTVTPDEEAGRIFKLKSLQFGAGKSYTVEWPQDSAILFTLTDSEKDIQRSLLHGAKDLTFLFHMLSVSFACWSK